MLTVLVQTFGVKNSGDQPELSIKFFLGLSPELPNEFIVQPKITSCQITHLLMDSPECLSVLTDEGQQVDVVF